MIEERGILLFKTSKSRKIVSTKKLSIAALCNETPFGSNNDRKAYQSGFA